ncbi:MAG: hypothetical protein HGA78_00840 [Nitrospirales bacterium]|nr:hypothetical protein [Nitrospirales bacterium]
MATPGIAGQGKKKVRRLAEAIILQSLTDLWDPDMREKSMAFFYGEGFRICAEIAGIGPEGRRQIMGIAGRSF